MLTVTNAVTSAAVTAGPTVRFNVCGSNILRPYLVRFIFLAKRVIVASSALAVQIGITSTRRFSFLLSCLISIFKDVDWDDDHGYATSVMIERWICLDRVPETYCRSCIGSWRSIASPNFCCTKPAAHSELRIKGNQ